MPIPALLKNQQECSKLQVLMAGHVPPPAGGVGTYYQSLLSSDLPKKVNLAFVQTSTHNRIASESGRPTFRNLIEAVKDCFRFTRALIKHKPQLCDISTAFGLSFLKHSVCILIARLMKCRILLHPHCSLSSLYFEHSRPWRWYFRLIIRETDGIIALSKEWETLSQIAPECPVFYLPNAIDTKPYMEIAHERIARRKARNELHVLYLGNLGKSKGSFDLLEAAKSLSGFDIRFVFDLVGNAVSPGEKEKLCIQKDGMNLSGVVNIHPPAGELDKLSFFRNADIFIYPSYSEGMPLAVIEAMACGLPVIASRVGGLPDLVTNDVNGLLVEPGQPDKLVSALEKIMLDPQLRSAMQRESYRLALEKYDLEQHVQSLVNVYQTTTYKVA